MNQSGREFIQSTMKRLDELLGTLVPTDQHDLLDELASEIEERMESVIESDGN